MDEPTNHFRSPPVAVRPRRLVFTQAYNEIKSMLDADLVFRFLQTDQFKSVRAQRENVTAMMVSPC